MRVLVLGGTGRIGSAVVVALRNRGAAVTVLCRNAQGVGKALSLEAEPLAGDIRGPAEWVGKATRFDAVVHAACTFDAAMGSVDSILTSALVETLSQRSRKARFIYTGGVWCFGPSGGRAIDEQSPFDPIAEFTWAVGNSRRMLRCADIEGMVLHPANVVARHEGGIPPLLLRENEGQETLRVPASAATRWPLVDSDDLAQAYVLALDRGKPGQEYLAASEPGAAVGRLAALAACRLGIKSQPLYEPASYWQQKYGNWASGFFLDQQADSSKAFSELGWTPSFRLA